MKKTTTHEREPSAGSLRAMPEIDFRRYLPGQKNPFAKRIGREGWRLSHEGPTQASLREMPEIEDEATGRANPYAARIRAAGITLQIGRGRPRAKDASGATEVKSVRLPPAVWQALQARARARGVTLHALVRIALLEWLARSDKP